jgi:hypothetical protein
LTGIDGQKEERRRTMTDEMVQTEDLERSLKVNFTEKERFQLGSQLGEALRRLKSTQNDLAAVSAQYKSDIKQIDAEIGSLAERLNSGWEMRKVKCVRIKDYNVGMIQIKRLDTLEIVEERAMDAEERQMGLFEEKEAPAGEDTTQTEPGVEVVGADPVSATESAAEAEEAPF